jgi:hypothetical protein
VYGSRHVQAWRIALRTRSGPIDVRRKQALEFPFSRRHDRQVRRVAARQDAGHINIKEIRQRESNVVQIGLGWRVPLRQGPINIFMVL